MLLVSSLSTCALHEATRSLKLSHCHSSLLFCILHLSSYVRLSCVHTITSICCHHLSCNDQSPPSCPTLCRLMIPIRVYFEALRGVTRAQRKLRWVAVDSWRNYATVMMGKPFHVRGTLSDRFSSSASLLHCCYRCSPSPRPRPSLYTPDTDVS